MKESCKFLTQVSDPFKYRELLARVSVGAPDGGRARFPSESQAPQLARCAGRTQRGGRCRGCALTYPVAHAAGRTDAVLPPVRNEERCVLNLAFALSGPPQGAALVAIFVV